MTQLDIFAPGPRGSFAPTTEHACGPTVRRDERTIEERFEAWIADNPHVFTLFRRLACEARGKRLKLGAKAIVERMRWEMPVETTGDQWRLNNSYTALLARRLVEVDGSFVDYFEFRERRSE